MLRAMMRAMMLRAEELANAFPGSRQLKPGRWVTCCPVHNGGSQNLYITDGDTSTLIFCHAGCDTKEILSTVGMGMQDLYATKAPRRLYDPSNDVTAMLIYRAHHGTISLGDARFINGVSARLRKNGYFVDLFGKLQRVKRSH